MGIASYTLETLPPVSKEEWDRVDAIKDEDIDCSDIPEITNLSGLRRRPARNLHEQVPVTCKLDADIVAWLKQSGKDYQTHLNTILRQVMTQHV